MEASQQYSSTSNLSTLSKSINLIFSTAFVNISWLNSAHLSWYLSSQYYHSTLMCLYAKGGTAAAVPPSFRPSDPALCGSCPL